MPTKKKLGLTGRLSILGAAAVLPFAGAYIAHLYTGKTIAPYATVGYQIELVIYCVFLAAEALSTGKLKIEKYGQRAVSSPGDFSFWLFIAIYLGLAAYFAWHIWGFLFPLAGN